MPGLDQDLIKSIVSQTVDETIRQLKTAGLLKDATDVAYHEITARLRQYYRDGETDPEVTEALAKLKEDEYFNVLPLFFRYGYTIEAIAETLGVDSSTIVRNKKRISLKVNGFLK